MANYTKREQTQADIHRMIEAGIPPPKYPMPRCFCGEEAKLHVHLRRGDWFYCAAYAEQAG